MSVWGVGPRILGVGYLVVLLVYALVRNFPEQLHFDYENSFIHIGIGAAFLITGCVIWLVSAVQISRGFSAGKLVTTGIYAITRNPLYSAHIVFIMPGIAVLTLAPIMLLPVIVTYAIFRILIKKEDEYLKNAFADDFEEYRRSVNQILPFPKIIK